MQQQLFLELNNKSSSNNKYWVQPIPRQDTYWFILNKHYAKRIPPISLSFGLFKKDDLVGIVTYGRALTQTVSKGICGEEYWKEVIELNRLSLLNNDKNEASILISKSLKFLPKPSIVVSYADTAQNHIGLVYQASNWIYTGHTHVQKDVKVKGLEHLHSRTIANMSNLEDLKSKHKDNVYHEERLVKHRYVYFVGDAKEVLERKNKLRYPILPYPKSN